MSPTTANTVPEELLERRTEFVNFVRRRVSDGVLAEDIVQGAYVRAVEHADSVAKAESAVGWFYAALRNAVVDVYRRRAAEQSGRERFGREHNLIGRSAQEPSEPHPAMRARFMCGCIQRVLPGMRAEYAEILKAVDLGEQPLAEFAKSHGLNANAAGVRAHRARKALRKELEAFCNVQTVEQCMTSCSCPMEMHAEAGS